MSNPKAEEFLKKLSEEDIAVLSIVISVVKTAQGWCRFNRWIFRVFLLGAAYLIITTSQAWDAVKNLIGWKH